MAALMANASGFKTLQQLTCHKIIKDQSNIILLKNEMGYVGSVEFIYWAIRSLRNSGGWKSVHQYIRKILYSTDLLDPVKINELITILEGLYHSFIKDTNIKYDLLQYIWDVLVEEWYLELPNFVFSRPYLSKIFSFPFFNTEFQHTVHTDKGIDNDNDIWFHKYGKDSCIMFSSFWKTKLDDYSGGVLHNIKWHSHKIIISGGALVKSLLPNYNERIDETTSDVDYFLYGNDDDKIKSIKHILHIYHYVYGDFEILIRNGVISLLTRTHPVKIQIVITKYNTPLEVVTHFDMTHLQIYFSGYNVYGSFSALDAWVSMVTQYVINLDKDCNVPEIFRDAKQIIPYTSVNEPRISKYIHLGFRFNKDFYGTQNEVPYLKDYSLQYTGEIVLEDYYYKPTEGFKFNDPHITLWNGYDKLKRTQNANINLLAILSYDIPFNIYTYTNKTKGELIRKCYNNYTLVHNKDISTYDIATNIKRSVHIINQTRHIDVDYANFNISEIVYDVLNNTYRPQYIIVNNNNNHIKSELAFVFKIKLSNCKIVDNDKMKNYSTVKTKIHRHCFEHLKNNYINDIDINDINGISIKNDRIATIKFAVENDYFEEYKSRCKDDYIYIQLISSWSSYKFHTTLYKLPQ